MSNPWRLTDDGLELTVRLTPKGVRNQINGIGSDPLGRPVLLVKVAAPPVDGAANKALVGFLSKSLKTAKSNISFISGETARIKRLRIEGDGEMLAAALLGWCRRG